MAKIITDLSKLIVPSEPLEFLTETGVDKTEGEAIIKKLKDTLTKNKTLIALAAPQIGIKKRIFCIKFNDVIKTFINPIITKKVGATIAPESFSSAPGKEILISRPNEVTIVYYNDEFKYEDNKLLGAAARIFDQQYQLLDGMLPTDLGLVSDIEEDGSLSELTDEEMEKLIDIYKQYIKIKAEAAQKEIENDEELTKEYKKLKFTEDVINGRTAVVKNEPKLNRATRRALDKANRKRGK